MSPAGLSRQSTLVRGQATEKEVGEALEEGERPLCAFQGHC